MVPSINMIGVTTKRSHLLQTKRHLKNLGIFTNAGYKFNDKQSLSLHLRNDDHKETGGNQTYKVNYTQLLQKFKIRFNSSTGLKNPSLYELYGSSNSHSGSTGIDPEKVKLMKFF